MPRSVCLVQEGRFGQTGAQDTVGLPLRASRALSRRLAAADATGWELGGSARAAPVTSHGSAAPSAAGIGVPVMRLVVTVHGKQPLLKPQYLGHLI